WPQACVSCSYLLAFAPPVTGRHGPQDVTLRELAQPDPTSAAGFGGLRKRNGNTKTPSRKTHRPPATGRRRSRRQQALLYSGARYTRNRARWRRPRLLLGRRVVRLERREPRFRWAEDGTSTLRLSSARRKDRPELSSRWPRSGRKRQRRTRAAAVS